MTIESLHKLFEEQKPGGVYWLKNHAAVTELTRICKKKGFAFFHIEGQKIEGKEQFLNAVSVAMHFPDYFGNNWDAFEDCLTDLDWIDAKGYVIYFDHTDGFASHHESQLETVAELFQDAVTYWNGEGKPMVVLLSGSQPAEGVKSL
jgi:RNAse (barnase) inhibitor barstar